MSTTKAQQQAVLKWKLKNPKKYFHYRHRGNARRRGFEISYGLEDFEIPEICPVLKIPIVFGIEGRKSGSNPSVDRIDPTKGYEKGNIRVISHRANMLKSNATVEELELILEDLRGLRK